MDQQPCAGIDLGALEARVAYTDGAIAKMLQLAATRPLILFDPTRNASPLGIGFPSVVQSIGDNLPFLFENGQTTPEAFVVGSLAKIGERLRQALGAGVAATAIAVPAAFSQRKRQVLLECAAKAGLDNVSLVERAICVALGMRRDREQSGTFVICHMDYSNCEYALVRLGRGRCWMVGSGLVPRVSGEMLTALVMEEIIRALRDRQVFLGLKHYTPTKWLEFRRVAEVARRRLVRRKTVELRLSSDLTAFDTALAIELSAHRYADAVRQLLAPAIDALKGLLDANDLDIAAIDGFLLAGDAGVTYPIADLFAETFPGKVSRPHDGVMAFGAVVCAGDAVGRSVRLPPQAEALRSLELNGVRVAPGATGRTEAPVHFAVVAPFDQRSRPTPARPGPPVVQTNSGGDRLEQAKLLKSQGRNDEARALLTALEREIDELRGGLSDEQTPGPAEPLIHSAQALIVDGLYPEAVHMAHRGYAADPSDPKILAAMMKIHADAATGMNKPEEYDAAIQILNCAHGHDPTDRGIHKAMAERHFLHAATMRARNNIERTVEAARLALAFDPKHKLAGDLLAEIIGKQPP